MLNGDPDGRFIEIGPADTLMSMLKKTFAQGSNDATGEQNAEFLTFMEEIARVHKVPDMVLEEPTLPSQDIGVSGTEAVEPVKADEPIKAAIATNTEVSVGTTGQISEIDDVPPLASEALLAIVASALKASRASIDTANSIKLLARGMYFLAMFLTRIQLTQEHLYRTVSTPKRDHWKLGHRVRAAPRCGGRNPFG